MYQQRGSLQRQRYCLPLSLLICTLRSDFKGGRKMVLQTQIFFLGLQPEKTKRVCRTPFLQHERYHFGEDCDPVISVV